jgi:sterol carrier protein 2
LGATGLAQCAEPCWQLHGLASNRLVPDASVALQHNIGLGGAAVVTVTKRADGEPNPTVVDEGQVSRSGYNPATEARSVTDEDATRVQSRTHNSDWTKAGKSNRQAAL